MILPSLDVLEAASQVVYRVMSPTPQICWPLLCARAGAGVWVKHENHTQIGAFKLRGGLVYMEWLLRSEPRTTGVVAATRGNHGQSVALAAARTGIKAVVVVPYGNSREKNRAMRTLGAELIEHGNDFQDAYEHATALAAARRLHLMPSFDDALVAGVGSYGLELFRAVSDLDTVYVPIGLGSGICGTIAARNALGLKTEVVGVVACGAPAYHLSFAAGHPVSSAAVQTIADGIAVRVPDPRALQIILQGASRIVKVDDDEIQAAMRHLYTDTHNVAEGAGAAALAALLQEREQIRGRRVAVILSGGNVDRELYAQMLSRAESPTRVYRAAC